MTEGTGRMMTVEDLANDPDIGWVASVMAIAKRKLTDGSQVLTVMFAQHPGGMDVVGVPQIAEAPEAVAEWLRRQLREKRATAWAIVSDVFVNLPTTRRAAMQIAAIGGSFASWPKHLQDDVRRRDALVVTVEFQPGQHRSICQFYRREGGQIIFEEVDVREAHAKGASGVFANLLPRMDA